MSGGQQLGFAAQSSCRGDRAADGHHVGARNFVEGGQVQDDSIGRWRDLFPLPPLPPCDVRRGSSVSSKRRSIKVQKKAEQANSIVDCLNDMYCAQISGDHLVSVTLAQRDSQHSIYKQLGRFKSPTSPCTVQEAVQELLRTNSTYDGEETSNTVRPYDRDLVSLPDCGDQPIPLSQVMDDRGRELVKDPLAFMLRDSEECGKMVEHDETFQPYMDPRLQADSALYAVFIKDLVDKGMFDFTLRPGDLVTPFFVVKKNGRLRFILDCRGVNKRFRDPPPLALAAGSTWSQLEVPSGEHLYVAQSDIRDYFFSLELPPDLQHLFCLPPISMQYLRDWGIAMPGDGLVDSSGWVWPRCRVIPMGWSWAMYIAQRVHQNVCLEASSLDTSRLLVEGRPAPDLSEGEVVLIPYADNLNVAGTDQQRVQQVKEEIVARLRHHGFRVHEETEATTLAQSLGFLIDGEQLCITPIPDRWTKVLQVFGWLATRPRVNGKAVERLLGHAVHFAMLRRELLSIFRSLYDFVARSYNKRQRLWASAAREANWAQHLFKLCSVSLKRPWSSMVTTSDASLSGVAVCSRDLPVREVARHGRVRETWRYVSGNPVRPREVLVETGDPFSDPSTVKPLAVKRSDPYELNFDFPDIEEDVMQKDQWAECFAIHMQHAEHITLLEGRGVVAALRHKFRATQQFGMKHLHFTDNMSVVLLCSKGRSGTFGMLRVCRRLACLLLATDSALQVRWVPSERNVADSASRQWEHLRHAAGGSAFQKEEAAGPVGARPADGRSRCSPQQTYDKRHAQEVAQHDPRRKEDHETAAETTVSATETFPKSDFSGDYGCFTAGGRRLPPKNAELLSVPEDEEDAPGQLEKEHTEVRRGLQLLHELHVRSRLRTGRRHKVPRSRVRHVPRLWPQAHSSPDQTVPSRVAEVGASTNQTASALGLGCSHDYAHDETPSIACGSSNPPQLHSISPTRRSVGPQKNRPGGADAKTGALVFATASCRAARKIQGGLGRRKHPPGFAAASMVGPSSEQAADPKQLSPELDLLRLGPSVAGRSQSLGTGQGPCGAISTKALRSLTRSLLQVETSDRSETTRTMGRRLNGPKIRSTCQTEPRVQRSAETCSEQGATCGAGDSEGGPKIFRPVNQTTSAGPRYVLEIFSGCARLSQACASAGLISIAYDIDYGIACDVLNPKVLNKILRFLHKKSHDIVLVWLGTPCTTWSRARKNDGGPRPLRDDADNLFGFADLSKSDADKVNEGNLLLAVTERIISTCVALNICWAVENPWTSRIWLTPQLADWIRRFTMIRVDFCAFQMPWRKATGILFGGPFSLKDLACECHSVCGRCVFTNRKHIVLVGKDSGGQWMTRRAQPYPWLLCHQIATILTEH